MCAVKVREWSRARRKLAIKVVLVPNAKVDEMFSVAWFEYRAAAFAETTILVWLGDNTG